jgi:hypothetical protein
MTETQAKSGGTGASTPVDKEQAEGGTPATGRAVVGRAVVPADAPSPPKFTRAPGMTPPPDEPTTDSEGPSEPERGPGGSATGSAGNGKGNGPNNANSNAKGPTNAKGSGGAKGSATAAVPVVTKGKSGSGTATGSTSTQPQAKPGGTGSVPRTGVIPGVKPGSAPPTRPGPAGPTRPAVGVPKRPAGAAASGSAAVGAARVTEAVRAARSTVTGAAARGPRRARLNLKRIDPWSVMKFAFAVSVVLFIVVVVATSVLYLALDTMGVWEQVNKSLGDLVNNTGGAAGATGGGFRITAWGIIGTSMLIGAVNVVLFTALATLGAFIYNVCADLVGGVELTLAERD